MPLLDICFLTSNRVAALWTILFFLAVGIKACLPHPLGEQICVVFLVGGTTFAFTCWNGPGQVNDNNGNRVKHLEAVGLQQPYSSQDNDNGTSALIEGDENNPIERNNAARTNSNSNMPRMSFLDNLKTFLTSLVVTHHVVCAFGGAWEDSWYLIVGEDGPPLFQHFVRALTLLDQAYFMPLFFFISAYFVPSSYARAGGWQQFQATKRRQFLLPALFVYFVVSPVAIIISGNRTYFPNPGVAWFLFWLLLFNLVYISFSTNDVPPGSTSASRDGFTSAPVEDNHDNTTVGILEQNEELIEPLIHNEIDFPAEEMGAEAAATGSILILSTRFRISCGIGICGLALIPFLLLKLGGFASMPLTIGSLTCDFFMFYLGLQASKYGWFNKSLIEQLDVHPMILVCFVAFEGIAMVAMGSNIDKRMGSNIDKWLLLLVIIAGMFCLDMSLLILVVFQRWANFETNVTRFLAKGAYGVYLLHPIVVTGTTQLYLNVPIEGINERQSAYFYPFGFVFVAVVSHVINWPLSYFLAQLPYLKIIL